MKRLDPDWVGRITMNFFLFNYSDIRNFVVAELALLKGTVNSLQYN